VPKLLVPDKHEGRGHQGLPLRIEQWLLRRLRHRRFYSLAELNAAIGELLRQLDDKRPIRRLGVARRALFEEIDRPNLNALPAEPYSLAEWRLRRVGVDYHVELDGHFYSVPYRFASSDVEVRLTSRAIEIFLKGERIAAHFARQRQTTGTPRCPSTCHRPIAWSPSSGGPAAGPVGRLDHRAPSPRGRFDRSGQGRTVRVHAGAWASP
jgi:hypothetical protein